MVLRSSMLVVVLLYCICEKSYIHDSEYIEVRWLTWQ